VISENGKQTAVKEYTSVWLEEKWITWVG